MAKSKRDNPAKSDNVQVHTGKSTTYEKHDLLKNTYSGIRKLCIALFIITAVVYANTLQNAYVLDDMAVIEKNKLVTAGMSAIPQILVTPRFEGFEHIINDSYRPLSLVTFAVEYQFFGPNPAEGHLFNILFFAGCVIFLFLFLTKLLTPEKVGVAFIAALLFAVHPIHTEVVANIKSRDELLCFFFAFWSLNVFANYAKSGKPMQLAGGAVLLFLSFLSKETVIAFLFVIPFVFLFYMDANKKRSAIISVATLLVSVVFLSIRSIVLKANDAGAIPFLDNPLVHAPFLSARLPTAIMVLGIYLKLLFVPYPLISDYSYNTIPLSGFGNVWVWLSLAVYVLLAVVGIYRLIKRPKDPLAFSILFFFATIALFSNIPFLAYSEMAERLAFFASAGFCLGIGILLWHLFTRSHTEKQNGFMPRKIWLVLGPVCLVFALMAMYRNADWKTNYYLTVSDIKKAPDNARLWHSMGYMLTTTEIDEEQDAAAKQQMIKEGIADLQRSLSIYPDDAKTHQDLGNFFRTLQLYDSAEVHLKEAIRLNPYSYVPVSDLGFVYFSAKKYAEALALSKNALQKDKKNADVINNMAMCYIQMQRYDSAILMANQALVIKPGNTLSLDYLSMARRAMEKSDTTKK